jgi:hypothetical protein
MKEVNGSTKLTENSRILWKRDFKNKLKIKTDKRKESAAMKIQNLMKMAVASRKIPKIK